MTYLVQSNSSWRSPRVQLAEITPAVLRLPDGSGSRGTLKTISLTGGLLTVSNTLERGSRVKLMFLTQTGPVLGAAEMLSPVSTSQQPFRFVALEECAQRRLREIVQSCLDPCHQAWIDKYRSALAHRKPPRRIPFRVVLEALTLFVLTLGCLLYGLGTHLLK